MHPNMRNSSLRRILTFTVSTLSRDCDSVCCQVCESLRSYARCRAQRLAPDNLTTIPRHESSPYVSSVGCSDVCKAHKTDAHGSVVVVIQFLTVTFLFAPSKLCRHALDNSIREMKTVQPITANRTRSARPLEKSGRRMSEMEKRWLAEVGLLRSCALRRCPGPRWKWDS